MTERKVWGLKEHARETVLQEVRVTPEMRARLEQRIHREQDRGAPTRRWRMGISAAVVAVAFFLVVGSAGWDRFAPPAPAPVSTPPAEAQVPPLAQREPPAPAGDTIPLTDQVSVVDQGGVKVAVTLVDSSGNALSYDTADEYGHTVAPAPSGIPGVETRPGQKIVLNADYTLEVADAHQAMQTLQAMALAGGGYVVEATLNQGEDGSWGGRLLLRIPSAQFGEATGQVTATGKVKHQRQWSQDVTAQYTDLQSRLTVLQEHEQKLQELALKAQSFDEWLRLAREINEVRTQIESMQGSLKQLANKVEYATLNIGLIQPAPGTVAVQQGNGLWQQMGAAFTGSLAFLGGVGRSLLIGLAGALPVVAVLGVGLVWFLLRRRRRAE